MPGGGCVRRIIVLLVLVVGIGAAWLFRDRLQQAWLDFRHGEQQLAGPTPELADQAEAKIRELRAGDRDVIALSGLELQSLLLYRYAGLFPAFLDSPTVELAMDLVRLRARVPIDKLPSIDALGDVAGLLPDTTELAVGGKLLPLQDGRVAFGIEAVSASRIPLPQRFVPGALTRIGRRDEPGLPPDAIAVALPPGVVAAYVRRDSLFLLSRRGVTVQ